MNSTKNSKFGKTNWSKLKQLTDLQVKKSAAQDADCALLTDTELSEFKRVFPPEAIDVKQTRQEMHLTQEQFAGYFGVSKRTIQEWEQGRRKPTSTARNFLKVLIQSPRTVRKALEG